MVSSVFESEDIFQMLNMIQDLVHSVRVGALMRPSLKTQWSAEIRLYTRVIKVCLVLTFHRFYSFIYKLPSGGRSNTVYFSQFIDSYTRVVRSNLVIDQNVIVNKFRIVATW